MLTKYEVLECIDNGENSGVEFKRIGVANYQIAKELVAFLNFEGGHLLLGVDDNGAVSGVKKDKIVEESITNICRDNIRPAIIPYITRFVEIQPGKDVVVVSVLRGISVHSRYYKKKNTYYIRVYSQSREPTTEELGEINSATGKGTSRSSTCFRVDFRRLGFAASKRLFWKNSSTGSSQ